MSGFSEPLLHMYNKNGAFVREQLGAQAWARLGRGRRVVLVLGDSLGDATMADGRAFDAVLKIGPRMETKPPH